VALAGGPAQTLGMDEEEELELGAGFESDRKDLSSARDQSLVKFVLEPSPFSQEDAGVRPTDGAKAEIFFTWRPLPAKDEDFPDPYEYMAQVSAGAGAKSSNTQRITFNLGECERCDAIETAVASMRRLETCVLRCGTKGSADPAVWTDEAIGLLPEPLPEAPASMGGRSYAPVDLLITLLWCEGEKDNVMGMSPEERVRYASERKAAAARYFGATRYSAALERYKMVVAVLDFTGDFRDEGLLAEARGLRSAARQNEAACLLKLGDTDGTIRACTHVLEEEPRSEKALYRRASAYLRQGRFSLAESDLKLCVATSPENREARRLLQQARAEAKRSSGREKVMYAKMLSADANS